MSNRQVLEESSRYLKGYSKVAPKKHASVLMHPVGQNSMMSQSPSVKGILKPSASNQSLVDRLNSPSRMTETGMQEINQALIKPPQRMGQQYTISFLQKVEQDQLIARSVRDRHHASLKRHSQLARAGLQQKQTSDPSGIQEEGNESEHQSPLSKNSPYTNLYDKLRSINLPKIEENEQPVTRVHYIKPDTIGDQSSEGDLPQINSRYKQRHDSKVTKRKSKERSILQQYLEEPRSQWSSRNGSTLSTQKTMPLSPLKFRSITLSSNIDNLEEKSVNQIEKQLNSMRKTPARGQPVPIRQLLSPDK